MEEKVTMYMDNKNRAFSMIADVEGDYSDLTNAHRGTDPL